MNFPHRATAIAWAVSAASALSCALPAAAADMTFTPAPGSGVVIDSSAGTPALRVQPTGEVQVPGLLGTPAAGSAAVCHDANGTLGRCDPTALAGTPGPLGPAGPAGDTGPAGAVGVAGPTGAAGTKGLTARVASSVEPIGANCATGGVRLAQGLDTNDNGTLDAGEITQTSYVCNGAQGAVGATGPQGPAGATLTGLAEVRHGCFNKDAVAVSGAGYSVAKDAGGTFAVSFAPALGAGDYTLLLDARTSTGRALAVNTTGDVNTGMVFTPGWLAADGPETIARICFMLAR